MDGIHDLGGMEGFGPVDVDAPGFKHPWEERMWALAKNTGASDWTLDWWRNMVEQMEPSTYLSVSYFEKWCLNYMTGFVSSGIFTKEEVVAGHTDQRAPTPAARDLDGALQRLRENELFYDRPSTTPPRFAIGDTVTTHATIAARHTRLPRYARGKTGTIIAHHGAHLFADLSARGIDEGQHLYTVEFSAPELWGDTANSEDSVTLDLWESYFVQT